MRVSIRSMEVCILFPYKISVFCQVLSKTNLATSSIKSCGCLLDEGGIGELLGSDSIDTYDILTYKVLEFEVNMPLF